LHKVPLLINESLSLAGSTMPVLSANLLIPLVVLLSGHVVRRMSGAWLSMDDHDNHI